MALSRTELINRILEVIRSESQDKTAEITLDTTIEGVHIDSVDVINILFQLEDEFKVTIDMDLQALQPKTVGDLVNALIEYIPHTDDPK